MMNKMKQGSTLTSSFAAAEVVPQITASVTSNLKLLQAFVILTSYAVSNQGWQEKVIRLLFGSLPLLATLANVRILLYSSTRVDVPQHV